MDDFFFAEKEAEYFERDDAVTLSEIEKLEVQEDLADIPRADLLLKTGLKQQKISVLTNLPKILASNNTKENLALLLDNLKALWKKNEHDNDIEIFVEILNGITSIINSTADCSILSYPLVTYKDEYEQKLKTYQCEKLNSVFLVSDEHVTKLVLPYVLDFIHDIQQKDLAESASTCIAATIPRITTSIKKTQIIRIGIEKGDVSQGAGSRLICCFVLGVLTASNLLSVQDIEGFFFQKMIGLCQDTDADVRRSMCIQLDSLARAVGADKACSELVGELLELLQDEEEEVKIVAFKTLISLFDFIPKPNREQAIMPVLLDIVEAPPDYLVQPLALLFGILVHKLYTLGELTNDNTAILQACYNRLGRHENVDIRIACAYNFPAAVKSFGANQYSAQLDELMQTFAQDKNEQIRINIISGMHEIANLLGQQRTLRYLKPISINALKDESVAVQAVAIKRLTDLFQYFCISVEEEQKNTLLELSLKSLLQYHELMPHGKWRDQIILLNTITKLSNWFSPTQVYEKIFPLLFEIMNNGVRPVQLEASKSILQINRNNKVAANRYSVITRFRKDYAQGKSSWQRGLYLDTCLLALDIYSRQYFRFNFLDPAIDLLQDTIPNVRYKAVVLLPTWRNCLSFPSDERVLERFSHFLEAHDHETDRDVLNAVREIREAFEQLSKLPSINVNNTSTMTNINTGKGAVDVEDKRRIAEEESLGLNADHEMCTKDLKWSEMLEYTLIVGKDGQVVRRARVKSIDMINKLRTQGKDQLMRATSSGVSKPEPARAKAVGKAATNVSSGTGAGSTSGKQNGTLPNCATPKSQATANSRTSSGTSSSSNSSNSSMGSVGISNSKSLADNKVKSTSNAGINSNSSKTPSVSNSNGNSSNIGAKAHAKENVVTKIPNIPVPTRPAVPAKRAQSPYGSSTSSSKASNSMVNSSAGITPSLVSTTRKSSGAGSSSGHHNEIGSNAKVTPLSKR